MVCCAIAAACSKSVAPSAQAPAATAASPAAAGAPPINSVVGKAPSAAGAVAIVVLEPRTPREFPAQTEVPVMDQVGETFGPELLLVRTGQPVEFRNSDDTLHNVHVMHEDTHEPAFNVAIPTGSSYTHTFTRDGFYHVGCDIHPAMAASVFAASSPFSAIAGADGGFAFTDVPAGAWRIVVVAGQRRLQKDVEVGQGLTQVTVE